MVFDSPVGGNGFPGNHQRLVDFSMYIVQMAWSQINPHTEFINTHTNVKVRVPQQQNGYDCGVFLILSAVHLLQKKEHLLDNHQVREFDLNHWYTAHYATIYYRVMVNNTISLEKRGWLTDDIIVYFLNQRYGIGNDVIVVPATLYPFWQSNGCQSASISGWTNQYTYAELFDGPKTWMIPIHEGMHWSMLCICNPGSLLQCQTFVFDSLARNGRPRNLESVKAFAGDMMISGRAQFPREANTGPTTIRNVTVQVPIQPNGFDCGVYCIQNMQKFVNNKASFFDNNIAPHVNHQNWYGHQRVADLRKALLNLHVVTVLCSISDEVEQ
jgi:Ulp1 family protease